MKCEKRKEKKSEVSFWLAKKKKKKSEVSFWSPKKKKTIPYKYYSTTRLSTDDAVPLLRRSTY